MVAAHLRGLLKPSHQFGPRSAISEEVILEGMSSEIMSHNMAASVQTELALIPALSQKGVQEIYEKALHRLNRASELRALDLFKVADQISGKLRLTNAKKELSLFQLYQIAEKNGIFEAFDEHFDESEATPLL